MSNKLKNQLYRKIERIIGEKIPSNLDLILERAGFETEESLLTLIDSNQLAETESYISENKDILKGTPYEYLILLNSVFKFKIGHKLLIQSIAKKLFETKQSNSSKKNNKKDRHDNGVVVIDSINIEEKKLKEVLIAKVVRFAKKNSIEIALDESFISEFERKTGVI